MLEQFVEQFVEKKKFYYCTSFYDISAVFAENRLKWFHI